jgi:hypothetical protein
VRCSGTVVPESSVLWRAMNSQCSGRFGLAEDDSEKACGRDISVVIAETDTTHLLYTTTW